jgi:hypothetical protein
LSAIDSQSFLATLLFLFRPLGGMLSMHVSYVPNAVTIDVLGTKQPVL